jgi:hypothetical protein
VAGLVGLVPRVDRDVNDAGREVTDEGSDQLGAGLGEDRHAVAALDAGPFQKGHVLARPPEHFFE